MERRQFLKSLIFAAPAIAIAPFVDGEEKVDKPKALLVDPYQVYMPDLYSYTDKEGIKIVKVRSSSWGKGLPITRIF